MALQKMNTDVESRGRNTLSDETERLLERIGQENRKVMVFGMVQAQAWPLLRPVVHDLIDAAGATLAVRNSYFACAQEMTRMFRTLAGSELARGVRRLFLKWRRFDLDPDLLQKMFLACFDKLSHMPASGQAQTPKPKLKPKHRSYAQALARGAGTRARSGSPREQAEKHRAGAERQRQVSARTRDVLAELGVPMRLFVRYNAVALKLDRLARLRTAKTLKRLALDLVERYESDGLDREVLLSLCRRICGIETPADSDETQRTQRARS